MFPVRCLVVAVVVVAAVGVAGGQLRSPVNRPWPPPVHDIGDVSRPLSAAEAVSTFHMPPGYRVELVASEPLVRDPVAVDWDPDGRLWVVEMPGYMRDVAAGGEHDPIGRIVVLQDRDADGRMDRRTVFADGLVMARAVKVLDAGVLVGEPPDLWLMRDTDGDLRADARERVTSRYGRREIDPQNNANALHWALDNRLHTAGQADILLRQTSTGLEIEPTLPRGQWGVAEDDGGRIYRNTNESALHVDLVPTRYYARHPGLLRTRGSYERLASGNPELNVVWPARPNPATNRAYQFGINRPDGTLARFTAVCAPVVYRGDRLPADLYGDVFVAEPAANLVSRLVVSAGHDGVRARKAYDRGEFLASTDERFRPVYLANAPDGTLYVVDLYRGLLEHRLSLTEYLRDHALRRNLVTPTSLGRIYRVVHETTRRDLTTGVSGASTADLVALLSHANGWWRDTAQRLIVERRLMDAVGLLARQAAGANDWRVRLRALWTLDGLAAIRPGQVAHALADSAPDVRRAAVQLAERWLGEPSHWLAPAVMARLHDNDASVRRQLAASIGTLPSGPRESSAAALLVEHGTDPIVLDATLSGLRGREIEVLDRLLPAGADRSPSREAAAAMLAATVVRSGEASRAGRLLDTTAGDRPGWQRAALLDGLEIALLGAPMPGTPPPATPNVEGAPCPTCPGGRAGPGGAYAYARPSGPPVTRPGGRLRLAQAPAAFARMAAGEDALGRRAAAVLSRLTWPGKPGTADLAPLTMVEQRRFDAGRRVYQAYCQACHQADGRGQERLAPSLVGSPLALAEASVPIRVLLQGKEGATGLMPPVGNALGDADIANVLTYIRREWGQEGAPVVAADVAAVRGWTSRRKRPWTDAELR